MRISAKISLLAFFFSLCGSAIFATHFLRLSPPAPTPRELYSVIRDQLSAFRTADVRRAYVCSTSGVRRTFTAQQFEGMIRRDFPALTQDRRTEFGLVEMRGQVAIVQVFLFETDGSVRPFLYKLVFENDVWKIAGVAPLQGFQRGRCLAGLHA